MNPPKLSAPVPLAPTHELDGFECGIDSLDTWPKRQARRNEAAGASRTYVVCEGSAAVGYYCLAAGAVARASAPKPMQRNMPDPIPIIVLGRLAIDRSCQGLGRGSALLRDAIFRVIRAAEIAGIRAILVHAISDDARAFYLKRGFLPSPIDPMTLCLPLETIRQALSEI